MTAEEFAARAVGVPWVRWRSDWQACDCFGLLVLYYREVVGIDLGAVPQTDIAAGFALATGWQECEISDSAACFMAWRSGAPMHCGIVLPCRRLLHAEGSPDRPGSVRISRLQLVSRLYGDLRFYRRLPTC